MKICPVCGLQAPLNATECAQCKHQYRTQFQPNQTQMVPPVVPPAPTPPSFWVRFWNPLADQKYQAELLVYMQQNGLITPEMRKRSATLFTILGVMLVLFFAWLIYDTVTSSQRMNAEIERTMRESREQMQKQFNAPQEQGDREAEERKRTFDELDRKMRGESP